LILIRILINIDRNNVLMNNSILSIGLDKENDLWLGLIMESFILRLIHQLVFFTIILVLWVQCTPVKTDKGFLMASNHGVFLNEK
jgi:hypothetical protein